MKKNTKKIKNLERKIIQLLKEKPKEGFNYVKIWQAVGKKTVAKEDVVMTLNMMWEKGKVDKTKGNKFSLTAKMQGREETKSNKKGGSNGGTAIGVVDMTASGSAYIISEQTHKDIYVPASKLNRAFDSDTVKVKYRKARNSSRLEGEVIEVVQRNRMEYVGIIKTSKRFAFLVPDRQLPVDLFIPLDELQGAKDGDKVLVQLVEWKETQKSPTAHVVQVLGKPGENEVEMLSILVDNGFPLKFSSETLAQADKLTVEIDPEEIAKRRDFRGVPTFTIDPDDAKDFDDALSVQQLDNGNWEIGIHIADVSHYVSVNSLMDKEASKRATSVYLVDRVLPMFPEKLSNLVCSLRPKEEKLCFSAVFEMNDKAEVVKEWFGRTVIYSDRRFTYEEAQQGIETGEGDFAEVLQHLNGLAKKMRAKRLAKGSIAFGSEEVKFKLDENKKPIEAYIKVVQDSNQLIEDFMLLANKRVSRFINSKVPPIPFVNRVHDEPDPEKLLNYKQLAGSFGYTVDLDSQKKIADSINDLLEKVIGKPEQYILESLAIRSMAKAAYSTENIGHYGLAFDNYTHFTSPIRRYPDVMVHRVLGHFLENGPKPKFSLKYLEEKCEHASMMERKAMKSERESTKYKQVEYISDYLGEDFDGIISGISKYGFWVELKDTKCEGMVRMSSLLDDHYIHDEKNYALAGMHTGKRYQMGQPVRVVVVKTDLLTRTIDFEVVEEKKVSEEKKKA